MTPDFSLTHKIMGTYDNSFAMSQFRKCNNLLVGSRKKFLDAGNFMHSEWSRWACQKFLFVLYISVCSDQQVCIF